MGKPRRCRRFALPPHSTMATDAVQRFEQLLSRQALCREAAPSNKLQIKEIPN